MKAILCCIFILSAYILRAQDTYWLKSIDMGCETSMDKFEIVNNTIQMSILYNPYTLYPLRFTTLKQYNFNGDLVNERVHKDETFLFDYTRFYTGKFDPSQYTENRVKSSGDYRDPIQFQITSISLTSGDTLFHFESDVIVEDSFIVVQEFFRRSDTMFWIGRASIFPAPFKFTVGYVDPISNKLVPYTGQNGNYPDFDNYFMIGDSIIATITGVDDPDAETPSQLFKSQLIQFNLRTKQYTSKLYDGNFTLFKGLHKLPSGGYVACGTQKIFTSTLVTRAVVVKFDEAFNIEWKKVYPLDFTRFDDLVVVNDTEFIVAGYFYSYLRSVENSEEFERTYAWLAKFNAQGDTAWNRFYILDDSLNIHRTSQYFKFIRKVEDTLFVGGYFLSAPPLHNYRVSPMLGKFNLEGCLGADCGVRLPDAAFWAVGLDGGLYAPTRLMAYPNPSSTSIYMNLPSIDSPIELLTVNVVDIVGNSIIVPYRQENASVILDIDKLAAGTYIVQLKTKAHQFTSTFIKL